MRFPYGHNQPLGMQDDASVSQFHKRHFFSKARQDLSRCQNLSQFSRVTFSSSGEGEIIPTPSHHSVNRRRRLIRVTRSSRPAPPPPRPPAAPPRASCAPSERWKGVGASPMFSLTFFVSAF